MTNKFENMSAYDIAEDIYENADTAGVDAAFEDLKSAAPAFRKEAVDALEKIIIKDLGGLADDYKMFGPVPEWFMADTVEDAASLADTQSCCQMLLHISQIKGNEAHPVTKELVKDLSPRCRMRLITIIQSWKLLWLKHTSKQPLLPR